MNMATTHGPTRDVELPNGAGAAALLAAGIGCAALGALTFLGDAFAGLKGLLNFHDPAGPLSGVTTLAIVVWLAAWFLLARKWEGRDLALKGIGIASFALLAIGFALTFPPVTALLQGK
jgi:hypothetical protein